MQRVYNAVIPRYHLIFKMKRSRRSKTPPTVKRPRSAVGISNTVQRFTRTRVPVGQVNVIRTFWKEVWAPSATTTNDFWRYYSPSLSQLPSVAEFAAVFDQYKINAIKITLRPKFDNYAGNDNTVAATSRSLTQVHTLIDSFSNVTPTGLYNSTTCNTFLENGKVKSLPGTSPVEIYFKPRIAATNQGIADSERTSPKWLSLANAQAVLQNGVHVFMQDVNFANNMTQSFDVFYTYYMQFRGLR